MATNYTSLLGFALPTTGELAGTWGQVVNDSITQLVEDSVAGTATVSVTSGNVTLTTTGSGAANQARCAIIRITGTPGTAREVIAPSQSKAYIVINQSDSNVTFKGAATTGHTLAPGDAHLLAWDGSDFLDLEKGNVVGPASATDNAVVRFDGTTGKLVQNSAVTIADTTGDITTNGQLNATTADLTNIEVTNIKAKDGTAAASIADSTGKITVSTELAVDNLNLSANTLSSTDTNGNIVLAPNGTGQVVVNAGTASLPIISPTGDGNTGIYFPAADQVGIATGGTLRVLADASGNVGIGTSSQTQRLEVYNSATNSQCYVVVQNNRSRNVGVLTKTTNGGFYTGTSIGTDTLCWQVYDETNGERLKVTSAGFTQPLAYADTVVALGNTGTATTITLTSGNVFTATLTGNCTFTLSSPIATGSSSFTLILTNDGTAGRTVAWSGGSFNFPGGAASLSRTTTANATDIWAFFTPNGGTTWYGNIVMKDVKA